MADNTKVEALDEYKYRIFDRVSLTYKSSIKVSDVHDVLIFIMRELNKFKSRKFFGSKLAGNEKKDIAADLLLILLTKFGFEGSQRLYTIEVIKDMIENIYKKGYHKK